MNWTKNQQKAIDITDKGILVSAGAGSGKTAVLSERVKKIVSGGNIDPSQILVVTFTKDAASSMKDKIIRAIDEQIEFSDAEQRKLLTEQRSAFETAKISTIDSFLLELVNSNHSLLGLKDRVKIIEESQEKNIESRACEEIMEESYEKRPEIMQTLNSAFFDRDDTTVAEKIVAFNRFLETVAFREDFIKQTAENFTDAEYNHKIEKMYCDSITESVEKARGIYDLIRYKTTHEINIYSDKAYELIIEQESIVAQLEKFLKGSCTLKDIKKKLEEKINWGTLRKSAKKVVVKNKEPVADANEQVLEKAEQNTEDIKNLRDKFKKTIEDICAKTKDICINDQKRQQKNRKIFEALAEMADALEERSLEMKLRQNLVSFSDCSHMAVELLVRKENGRIIRTPLAEEIVKEERYKIIIVDEYQDVNNLQDIVIRAVSNTEDLSVIGSNMFAVGDIKQAIYRFRNANPEIFNRTRETSETGENSQVVYLNDNFRSRCNVLDSINYIFDKIMSYDVGEVDYDNTQKLIKGAGFDDNEDEPTEIMLITEDTLGGEFKEEHGFGTQETAVALRIKDLLESGTQVYDNNIPREIKESDICVLVRNNIQRTAVSKALEYVGISADMSEENSYLKSPEIITIISALKAINNPMDELSLTSLLLSECFMFSMEDIAKIKLFELPETAETEQTVEPAELSEQDKKAEKIKKQQRNNLYFKLMYISENFENLQDENLDGQLCGRIAEAYKTLSALRMCGCYMSVSVLIEEIYAQTDLYAKCRAFPDCLQRQANLRKFPVVAMEYEDFAGCSLYGFIEYLKRAEIRARDSANSKGKDMANAFVQSVCDERVQIKTIHASKGLEYPFVFLCGADVGFNNKGLDKANNIFDGEMGAGLCYKENNGLSTVNTIEHSTLKWHKIKRQKSEEMRLLYVALTRAKERLFITLDLNGCNVSLVDFANPCRIKNAESMGQWLIYALCQHRDMQAIRDYEQEKGIYIKAEEESIGNFEVLDSQELFSSHSLPSKQEEPEKSEQEEREDSDKINRQALKLAESFGGVGGTNAVAKMSVTEFIHMYSQAVKDDNYYRIKNAELNDNAVVLPQFAADRRFNPAQIGTLMHNFMQLADFKNAQSDTSQEISRLKQLGYFTDEEAAAIGGGANLRKLSEFFDPEKNSLYAKMLESSQLIREKKFLVKVRDMDLEGIRLPEDIFSENSYLQGIADCIFEQEDGYVIVDYKTDGVSSMQELVNMYALQVQIYKAAFAKILDKPVKHCVLYSFKLCESIEV